MLVPKRFFLLQKFKILKIWNHAKKKTICWFFLSVIFPGEFMRSLHQKKNKLKGIFYYLYQSKTDTNEFITWHTLLGKRVTNKIKFGEK